MVPNTSSRLLLKANWLDCKLSTPIAIVTTVIAKTRDWPSNVLAKNCSTQALENSKKTNPIKNGESYT